MSATRYGMSATGGDAHVELSRAGRVARAAELLELGRTEHALVAIDALRADALADDGDDARVREMAAREHAVARAPPSRGHEEGAGLGGAAAAKPLAPVAVREASAGPGATGFSAALQSGQLTEDELVARALRALAA